MMDTAVKVLALGGARSGKSGWAEDIVASFAASSSGSTAPVHYIATARPWPGADDFDADFQARVQIHRARRPDSWVTVDAIEATEALLALASPTGSTGSTSAAPAVLLDDVGTWLTHIFDRDGLWDSPRGASSAALDAFVGAVHTYPGPMVLVSPEVGMGVIPEHHSGRLFRDEIGALNARLAELCQHVVLVVAGLPMPIKGGLPSTA